LHEAADRISHLLGDGWTLAEPSEDQASHLHGPDDRQISMKAIRDGSTVQLWITGYQPAALDRNASEDERLARSDHLTQGLPAGRRYNAPWHLNRLPPDADLAQALLNKLRSDLLPVWDRKPDLVGHRPWDHAPATREDTAEPHQATGNEAAAPTAPASARPAAARATRKPATGTTTPAATEVTSAARRGNQPAATPRSAR